MTGAVLGLGIAGGFGFESIPQEYATHFACRFSDSILPREHGGEEEPVFVHVEGLPGSVPA